MKPSEIIRNRGFTKGALTRGKDNEPLFSSRDCVNGTGPVCAMGALIAAYADEDGNITESFHEVVKALKKHLGIAYVPDWNDAPAQTAEQVIEAFEAIGQ